MKKQLAIATVAIMLTAVLIVPTVMAFALWDENSVQYSSHWSEGYNSITHKSVTASNQSIAIGNGIGEWESSSRLKYYRAPVPVRTSNWSAIVMGTGIRECKSISKVYHIHRFSFLVRLFHFFDSTVFTLEEKRRRDKQCMKQG